MVELGPKGEAKKTVQFLWRIALASTCAEHAAAPTRAFSDHAAASRAGGKAQRGSQSALQFDGIVKRRKEGENADLSTRAFCFSAEAQHAQILLT